MRGISIPSHLRKPTGIFFQNAFSLKSGFTNPWTISIAVIKCRHSSSFQFPGCLSLLVASSNPRTACSALYVGPSAGRQVPCLYTTLAGPQPGTLSAYSLKSHGTGVPERQIKKAQSSRQKIVYFTTFN